MLAIDRKRSADGAMMPDMAQTPAHAKPAPRNHDRPAAWLVLIGAGATTMSFNIWHAVHAGMPPILAPLEGVAPVVVAMGLSHVVSAYRGGWFMKAATFGIMLAAMVLSLDATGNVVHPALGPLWWLFGLTVDAAALVALQVILSPESRAAARTARKAARSAAAEAVNGAVGRAVPVPPAEPAERPSQEPAGMPSEVPSARPAPAPRPRPVRISKDPEAEKARADYRRSVRQGQLLSDRALGEKYGRSRSWGAARIRETEAGPQLAGTGS